MFRKKNVCLFTQKGILSRISRQKKHSLHGKNGSKYMSKIVIFGKNDAK